MIRSESISSLLGLLLFIASGLACCGCGSQKSPASSSEQPPKTSRNSTKTPAEKPRTLSKSRPTAPQAKQPLVEPRRQATAPTRPARIGDEALAELGIRRFASRRLVLYTDIKPSTAAKLPPYADALYDALVNYFGPLPKSAQSFQMTGHIMAEKRLFRETKLLPDDLPGFFHGKHRGTEFWMNEQKYEYYRRHLLLHEATHSFMTGNVARTLWPPLWYLEGMAELFGTHRVDARGNVEFRVIPEGKAGYEGHGRIAFIQKEIAAGRALSLREVMSLKTNDFLRDEMYAWSWALCVFLDTHPRYQKRFREVGRDARVGFTKAFTAAFADDVDRLATEWWLFAHAICHGIDVAQFPVTFSASEQALPAELPVHANRGWHDTGVQVRMGRSYRVIADGRFSVAQSPKPWVSEANGITIRYARGLPLGCLVGWIDTGESHRDLEDSEKRPPFQIIRLGNETVFQANSHGRLFLRLNDELNSLADNAGKVTVKIADAK